MREACAWVPWSPQGLDPYYLGEMDARQQVRDAASQNMNEISKNRLEGGPVPT